MKNVSINDITIDFLTFLNYINGNDENPNWHFEDFSKFIVYNESNYFESLNQISRKAIVKDDIDFCKELKIIKEENNLRQNEINEFPLSNKEINKLIKVYENPKEYVPDTFAYPNYDLERLYELYINLFKINNTGIPVTHFYFYAFLIERETQKSYNKTIKNIKYEYDLVENNLIGFERIFKNRVGQNLEEDVFKAINDKSFFTSGIIDNDGIFLNKKKNFISLIKRASKDEKFEKVLINLSKESLEENFKQSHSYLSYNWYNRVFLSNEINTDDLPKHVKEEIILDTGKYEKLFKWSEEIGLIKFLEEKYSSNIIKAIITIITQKDFSNLSIRSHNFESYTELFTFCYCVGYFDFLTSKKQNLESVNGFELLNRHLNFFEEKTAIKLFRDYYKQRNSPTNPKRYPFKKYNKVKNIMIQRLGFKDEKIKKLNKLM